MRLLAVTVGDSYAKIPAERWDALVGDGSPFLEHAFLSALEETGCASPDVGWTPRPILLVDGDRLVGAAPGWVKTHSMGEFVYDMAWADAARRAGIPYYPKLVVGVPFSPVTGTRLLLAKDAPADARERLLAGVRAAAADTHGVHVLFDTPEEAAWLGERGVFPRVQYQFWWTNDGYASWEDFLTKFPSKQRNKLRRERKEVAHLRFEVGRPSPEALDKLFDFYTDTTAKHFWGRQYLTRAFFRRLGETWGHRLHAVVARDEAGAYVAGALNVHKGDRLYGRYWGAAREVPFLHFEVCYHRAIDWCIANGVRVFEPGHGGEHKYRRGFVPHLTWSSHQLGHRGLNDALRKWSSEERKYVEDEVAALREKSPTSE